MEKASDFFEISIPSNYDHIIVSWQKNIVIGAAIRANQQIATYIIEGTTDKILIKSPVFGKIVDLCPANIPISLTNKICIIKKCCHDVTLNNMCTFCGLRVENCSNKKYAILEKNNELSWSKNKAIEVLESHKQKMLQSNKLILILDLDNTLIHSHSIKENYHYDQKDVLPNNKDLYLISMPFESYYVKLRPLLREFLHAVAEKFVIFIYTMGTRPYAEFICNIIDPEAKIIKSDRIISRCDNGSDGNERKILDKITEDRSLTLILDDNQLIWPPAFNDNLIFTKEFFYFEDFKIPNSQEVYVRVRRKEDSFLYFMEELLLKIHNIYFTLYEKNIPADVREIYKMIKMHTLKDVNLVVSGLFKKDQEIAIESEEYKIIREMNGIFQYEINLHTNYLIADHYKKTAKILKAKSCNIPILNKQWLFYSQLYAKKLNPKTFELTGSNSEIFKKINSNRRKNKDEIILLPQLVQKNIIKNGKDMVKVNGQDKNVKENEKNGQDKIINEDERNNDQDKNIKEGENNLNESNNDIALSEKNIHDKNVKDEKNSQCTNENNEKIEPNSDIMSSEKINDDKNVKNTKELLIKEEVIENNTQNKQSKSQAYNNMDRNEAKDKLDINLIQDNPISIFMEEKEREFKEFIVREFELQHCGKRRLENE